MHAIMNKEDALKDALDRIVDITALLEALGIPSEEIDALLAAARQDRRTDPEGIGHVGRSAKN
jgi:hypothetical protein